MENTTKVEQWYTTGLVEFGEYPFNKAGYGVESESGKKIALATTPDYALQIVKDHNKVINVGQVET